MSQPIQESEVAIHRRRLPHWTLTGSVYFVTFRVRVGSLTTTERVLVREHIQVGHGRYYDLAAAVVMPDHVHLILRPRDGYTLSRVMHGIKGVTARKINLGRNARGTVWQDESWDRILRDEAEYQEKLQYMLDNPVKAGLCQDGWDFDGWCYHPGWEEGRQECLPHQKQ